MKAYVPASVRSWCAATLLILVAAGTAAAQQGAWKVTTSKTRLDGSTLVDLELNATPPAGGGHGAVIPKLQLRCLENAPYATIVAGPAGTLRSGDELTVQYQLDGARAVSESWNGLRSADAVMAPDANTFIKRLEKAKRLRIQAPAAKGGMVTLDFPLAGLSRVIKPLAAACTTLRS